MLRALVVEDCPDSARVVSLLLEAWGYHVEVARNGTEALVLAAEFLPDVVVADIGLPGLDGLYVARQLRSTKKDVLLVALTGRSDPEDIENSKIAGFDHHLVKPLDGNKLRTLLDRHRTKIIARGITV